MNHIGGTASPPPTAQELKQDENRRIKNTLTDEGLESDYPDEFGRAIYICQCGCDCFTAFYPLDEYGHGEYETALKCTGCGREYSVHSG